MFQYIIKRILFFVPTFFVISLVIFGLSKMTKGDPVVVILKGGVQTGMDGQRSDIVANEKAYAQKAQELGLDKPNFYFTISSAAYPKDLYKTQKAHHRTLISRLIDKYGNAKNVLIYYKALKEIQYKISDIESSNYELKLTLRENINELFFDYNHNSIRYKLNLVSDSLNKYKTDDVLVLRDDWEALVFNYKTLVSNTAIAQLYIPNLNWYGFNNQYHTWMFGDYPWLGTVDSSAHQKIGIISTQIKKLRPQESKISRAISSIKGKNYKLKKRITGTVAFNTIVDSLLANYTNMTTLRLAKSEIPTKIKILFEEKDSIENQIKNEEGQKLLRGGDQHKIEISAQIEDLKLNEKKINNKIKVLKDNNKKLKKEIPPTATVSKIIDSLIQNYSKINDLELAKGEISFEIKELFIQRDLLSTQLKHYVSKGFLRGDFGISYTDRKKVSTRISEAVSWTLIMNLIALFLAYFISIPLGVYSAMWKAKGRKIIDNINTAILFVLYSLPSFWIGTLLLVFFTTSEYGEWLDWFPSSGAQNLDLRDNPNVSSLSIILDIAHHLALPIFCITYGSLAYLSRQMRGSMLGVIRKDYIRTARAKGLSENKVIWKHAFRNSLFPIITLFSSVFPRALSGAIAIEIIFAIPGMGFLLLMSITARDWPVVFAIVMLMAIMAMIGNLIADIMYAIIDPRVTY